MRGSRSKRRKDAHFFDFSHLKMLSLSVKNVYFLSFTNTLFGVANFTEIFKTASHRTIFYYSIPPKSTF